MILENYYKDSDNRTALGIYIEIQVHYFGYLIGAEFGKNGSHMGPTYEDKTGLIAEIIANIFSIKGIISRVLGRIRKW